MLKLLLSKKLLVLCTMFDLSTSIGLRETNPILGRGTFGVRQGSIMGGITIGQLLIEHKYKNMEKVNIYVSGIHTAAGISNLVQRTK